MVIGGGAGSAGFFPAGDPVWYAPMFDGDVSQPFTTAQDQVLPIGGTLSNFHVRLHRTTAGDFWSFTVLKNSVDTSVSCTGLGSTASCSDTTNSISFAAGDRIAIKITQLVANAPGNRMQWTAQFTPG